MKDQKYLKEKVKRSLQGSSGYLFEEALSTGHKVKEERVQKRTCNKEEKVKQSKDRYYYQRLPWPLSEGKEKRNVIARDAKTVKGFPKS